MISIHYLRKPYGLLSLFIVISCLYMQSCSPNSNNSRNDQVLSRDQINEMVRNYISQNPEVIEGALQKLQERAVNAYQKNQERLVSRFFNELTNDDRDPSFGKKSARVQIIFFTDYRCPFCKLTSKWLWETFNINRGDIRVVVKELPVLGTGSTQAAKASLAIFGLAPSTYIAFHEAVMNTTGQVNQTQLNAIMLDLGLDIELIQKRMAEVSISQHLADTQALARDLGVNGTPFFIINGSVFSGADINKLQKKVDENIGL